MKVLLTGSSGFVGSAILRELTSHGVEVVAAVRRAASRASRSGVTYVEADFTQMTEPESWLPLVSGVDCVINAVGIIRQTSKQKFAQLHADSPRALFSAARSGRVARVVQISAFGVRSDSPFPYFTSKFQADEFLQDELSDRCLILRPSLVYGARGEATQLFRRLATLPVVPLPAGGKFRFRPVLVEDLARLVVEGVLAERMPTGVYDVGGAEVMTLEQILLAVRAWSQHVEDKQSPKWTHGPTMSVPLMLMRPAAWSGDLTKMGPLDSDMLGMLVRSEAPEIGPLLADFTTRPRGLFTYLQEHPDDSEERSLQEGSW